MSAVKREPDAFDVKLSSHVKGVIQWLAACAILDKGILARKSLGVRPEARWFLLHSIANAIVAGSGWRDVLAVLRRPDDAICAPEHHQVPEKHSLKRARQQYARARTSH